MTDYLAKLLSDNEHLYKQVARHKVLELLVRQFLKELGDLKHTGLKDIESLKKIELWLKK